MTREIAKQLVPLLPHVENMLGARYSDARQHVLEQRANIQAFADGKDLYNNGVLLNAPVFDAPTQHYSIGKTPKQVRVTAEGKTFVVDLAEAEAIGLARRE